MTDFATASAVRRLDAERFAADVPEGWQQGRGAFGGLVLATLLRAIEASEPDRARVTRTLTGDLCGPVLPGAAELEVRTLRRGNNQSNLFATLTQGGAVLGTSTVVLSPARAVEHAPFSPAPPAPLPPWRDVPLIANGPPVGPAFTQNYEYRAPGGAFARTDGGAIDGWIGERVTLPTLDAPALIGRLDAWWPTLFALDGRPRPVATISFAAEILVDPATLPPDEPLRYRARMAALHEGFFVELRELWQGERVVALNQQTFAILR
jgi:hypothetical protein